MHPEDDVWKQAQLAYAAWDAAVAAFNEEKAKEKAAKAAASPAEEEGKKKKKKEKVNEYPKLFWALWPQLRGLWRQAFLFYATAVALTFVAPILLTFAIQLFTQIQQCGLAEEAATSSEYLLLNETTWVNMTYSETINYNALIEVDAMSSVTVSGELKWAELDVMIFDGEIRYDEDLVLLCWFNEECPDDAYYARYKGAPRVTNAFGFNRTAVGGLRSELEAERARACSARAGPRHEFLCPITLAPMRDPVCAADGHSYERSAIERWFSHARGGGFRQQRGEAEPCRSPVTNLVLPGPELTPNVALRKLIEEWRAAEGQQVVA